MNVIQEVGELDEYWNALFPDEDNLHVHGSWFLVADFLIPVPDWARWKAVQPSGLILLTEYPPCMTEDGWVATGHQANDCGVVTDSSAWQGSLALIEDRHGPISAHAGRYCSMRQMRKHLPDTTWAITMGADGAIIAWPHVPSLMDGTWQGHDGELGQLIGWHAAPNSIHHNRCIFIESDNGRLAGSATLQ